ncbi:Piwi domain-domain-containing protein [Phakopsora pachyrhizi]|uniref:Piwi domain-domain-containing protein n=1 Tax=Phakopsora pachyrhizi TaxID=170000 RepID=A0AAV0BM66_PHAPC|nr:Piwi domain-domain-containing protein [Phakopsora pachyrhizi]
MSGAAESQVTRPGVGRNGIKIQVTVNAYKVAVPSHIVHHYDLAIQGLVGSSGAVGDAFGNIPVVHDGRKNVFALKNFGWTGDQKTFDVDISDNPERGSKKGTRKFKVVITKVSQANLDSLVNYVNGKLGSTADEAVFTAIAALNIICNHDVMSTCANSRNKLFPAPPPLTGGDRQSDHLLAMRGGLEMWRGYFSSIRMAPEGIILNFDLSSQTMIKSGDLHHVAAEIAGVRGGPQELANLRGMAVTNVSRMLKTITVSVERVDGTRIKCKIKEVGSSARAKTFEGPVSPNSDEMRQWTVMEYIEKTYNRRLSFPDLPLVRLTAKAWYPMELCKVPSGQKYNKKLTPDQLSEAIRWLTVKPQERTQMLTKGVAQHLARSPSLSQWGVKINPTPLVIAARRLPPPTVNLNAVQNGQLKVHPIQANNGQWNLTKNVLFKPEVINSWVAVAFGNNFGPFNAGFAQKALGDLEKALSCCGLKVSGLQGPTIFATPRDGPRFVEGQDTVGPWIMSKVKSKPKLIVCFLKDKNAWQYRQIKVFGDSQRGLATQCLAIDKVVSKGNAQYYANVSLKINAKLGGINHAVGERGPIFKTEPTMLMGADVTHPGMDSIEPSVAAVVGSTNEHGLGYAAEFSVQPGRQEIIGELDVMAKDLLLKFHQRNKTLPRKLIFYRDGVSEGQFGEVIQKEIPLLRKAFKQIGIQAPPLKDLAASIKLTFIVCGKRHHFKFGPSGPRDADRNGNLLPGVIVDSGVTHPFHFDWYGLSHAGLLGTSRASHYTVLVDDSKFKPDDIQSLTFQLCFLYSRSTRSVSIATPAYYAHHVCTRAKLLIGNVDFNGSGFTPSSNEKDEAFKNYQGRCGTLKNDFQAAYNKAGNFPVTEYWM